MYIMDNCNIAKLVEYAQQYNISLCLSKNKHEYSTIIRKKNSSADTVPDIYDQ